MGIANIGKETDRRLDDGSQFFHFAGQRYAGFKNGQCMLRTKLPNTERYTDLRIIALRASRNDIIGLQ